MWRVNTITLGLVVFAALLFIAGGSYAPWDQDKTTTKEVNLIQLSFNAPLNEAIDVSGSVAESTKFSAAVPPYIILSGTWNSSGSTNKRAEIQITIQSVAGSYSEYAARQLAERNYEPIAFANARNSGLLPYGTWNEFIFE